MSTAIDDVIDTVARTAPEIRAGLPGRREKEGGENPSGERQVAADVYADDLLQERLLAVPGVAAYASEEKEDVIEADEIGGDTEAELYVGVDPLDGSSNIKSNNAMGTLLAVYDAPLPASGRDLVASAYVLFGPIVTMMVAREGTTTEYLVREDSYEVINEDVRLPTEPEVYGFGGRVSDWPAEFTEYVRELESDGDLKLRYGGAMIGDVNQVMTYGGIFGYPALQSSSAGKLRLQFEGNPIAHIVENAGGASTDGERSLLDVEPERLHQRVPVHVGNEALIDRLEEAFS